MLDGIVGIVVATLEGVGALHILDVAVLHLLGEVLVDAGGLLAEAERGVDVVLVLVGRGVQGRFVHGQEIDVATSKSKPLPEK